MSRSTRVFLATASAAIVVVSSCSKRDLRPLNPCTSSGVSDTVPIDDVRNVDLLFVVDNSGSMRPTQAKLRSEFPSMIRALLTGNTDTSTPEPEWPSVGSLRVAVVTSDLGVAGVGTTLANPTKISSCGANPALPGGIDVARALYGDDGGFRLRGSTIRVNGQTVVNCDVLDASGNPGSDGVDDSVTAAQLPSFLTFDTAPGTTPLPADVDEYVRRVSCFTNTGTTGCPFEQQLESMLKALTPSDPTAASILPGGPFFHEINLPARGYGQGTDTNTTPDDLVDSVANGGWLRDDSLLAIVQVSDEEDCSAGDPRVFDFNLVDPTYGDPYGRFQSQTRCARHPELSYSVQRYVDGLVALRARRLNRLVFAAITGVPPDLTDGAGAAADVIEGTDNIAEILADGRMAYEYLTNLRSAGPGGSLIDVSESDLRPACTHTVPGRTITGTGDLAAGIAAVGAFMPSAQTPATPITGTGDTTLNGSILSNFFVPVGSPELVPGMSVSGPGITPGTIAYDIATADIGSAGPYLVYLSSPATASATGVTIDIGATYGPARGQRVSGAGLRDDTIITSVDGVGPYTLTLENRVVGPSAGAVPLLLERLDVSATPARRMAGVARDLKSRGANVTVQSICVDSFAPAMGQILRLIQSNLSGSCLPRRLVRNALNSVTCDVFVTLPPNTSCSATPGMVAIPDSLVATTDPSDTDQRLERCRMVQIPVTGADVTSGNAPGSAFGWFYDDYTDAVDACSSPQRINFTVVGGVSAKPPTGSELKFGCLQPVQDGDLAVDINSACSSSLTCPFADEPAYDSFSLRYNLNSRGWTPDIPTDPTTVHQLVCEPNTLTCQIGCGTDADCPGGFVCFDPATIDSTLVSNLYCVNPTCGFD